MEKRITIIEDNKEIREGFALEVNNTEKYDVIAQYSNCEDAISRLDDDLPDVILMDIGLPGMSGIEGTEKIKKRLPQCVILVITVMEHSEKVFQSLCAGADGYIVKNSAIKDIVKCIDEALLGGAPMSLPIARMVVQSFQSSKEASPISYRETEVLEAIARGKSYTRIAEDLFISKETVRSHIKHIYEKLSVNSKAEALRVAGKNKWINKNW